MWVLLVSEEAHITADTTPWRKQWPLQKWRDTTDTRTTIRNIYDPINYTFYPVCLLITVLASVMQLHSILNYSSQTSKLPVEFGAFNKCVSVSISNDHFTAHTSEAFRMVFLVSSDLFIQGDSLIQHNAEAKRIILFFTRRHLLGSDLRGQMHLWILSYFCSFLHQGLVVLGCFQRISSGLRVERKENTFTFISAGNQEAGRLWMNSWRNMLRFGNSYCDSWLSPYFSLLMLHNVPSKRW